LRRELKLALTITTASDEMGEGELSWDLSSPAN
jgi:hypothetical protein